jgi:excisionase family DNA binding protein
MPIDREALMTAKQAAQLLRISRSRVYELAQADLLPVVRLGRTVRFSPAALQAFLAQGGRAWEGGWRRQAPVDRSRVKSFRADGIRPCTGSD